MRKPPLEIYDTNANPHIEPEEIDMADVIPIKSKKSVAADNKQSASSQPKTVTESATTVSRNRDATTPSNRDTVVSRHQDTVETVRRAVKEVGKEAATHRFTVEEKRALAEIIFEYGQQGIRTSENEIARIAINYLIEEHTQQGEDSILAKVLRKLNV